MFENCSDKSFIYFFVYICHFTCRCRAKKKEKISFHLKNQNLLQNPNWKHFLKAGKFQKKCSEKVCFYCFLLYTMQCNFSFDLNLQSTNKQFINNIDFINLRNCRLLMQYFWVQRLYFSGLFPILTISFHVRFL